MESREMSFLDRIFSWLGFEVDSDEEKDLQKVSGDNRVVSLHKNQEMKVLVIEPKSFEAAQIVANNLKTQQPVIVNLENADFDLAKRVIDFISGTTYALNGSMRKIGESVFLFTPNNIVIDGKEFEKTEEDAFLWNEPQKN